MTDVLTTTRTVKPGVYIGRVFTPTPTGLSGFNRLPCLVGKGSRYVTQFNQSIRRSYLNDILLSFNSITHIATLAYDSDGDQTISELKKSDGTIVPASKWLYQESVPGSSGYDQVLILPEIFDATATYYLSYQSTSRLIEDELPFSDLREMRFVGDTQNQEKYVENVDYYIPIAISAVTANAANAHSTGKECTAVVPVGTPGTLTVADATGYNHNYNRRYTITVGSVVAVRTGIAVGPDAFTGPALDIVTLTVAASPFLPSDVGKKVVITKATTPANEGIFTILSVNPGGTAVTYLNAAGVAEVYPGIYGIGVQTSTNTGDTIGGAAPNMTLTDAAATWTAADVGKHISISGATTPANEGVFEITAIDPTGKIASYTNGGGVAEAFAGGTWCVLAGVISCTTTVAQGSGGLNSLPPCPIHSSITSPIALSFVPNTVSVAVLTDVENPTDHIDLQLDDTASLTGPTDGWTFTALGPSLVEIDSAISNTNQFSELAGLTAGNLTPVIHTGFGVITPSVTTNYTGTHDRKYKMQVTAIGGVSPAATATIRWCGYGEGATTEGSVSLIEATPTTTTRVLLEAGIYLDYTFGTAGQNFAVDDTYTFTAKAARSLIGAKDSRNYVLTVNAATTAGNVPVLYETGTAEGRFGTTTVTGIAGELKLPGGVNMYLRNIGTLLAENRYVAADKWTWSTTDEEVVNWLLDSRLTETIATTEFHPDVLGTITGHVGYTYVILQHTPDSVISVLNNLGVPVAYSTVAGQPIVYFVTAPTTSVSVKYQYRGQEPDPGNIYYVTANAVRPTTLYNVPILSQTWEEAQLLLGPSATNNDLLIGAELVLNDNGAPGLYTCQAYDSDSDGVVTVSDVNTAIIATALNSELTDIIVLNSYGSLSTALSNNVQCNDPFEKKERALWVGAPVSTTIGNVTTPDTLVYLAKNTLQVYGESQAHGTRVLVGNVTGVKTITLTDGSQVDVTLDGSFAAAAVAALNASFTNPNTMLLRQNISGFKSLNTYNEAQELQLIAAGIIYCSNQGSTTSPVYRIEESTTVDASSDDNKEINVAINQKTYVTRDVRTSMDSALISIVPPSEQAGVSIVKGYLVSKLAQLVASGITGPYQDSNGNVRQINPDSDVEVFRATNDKTLYHFKYFYYGIYGIKRLFGLFSTDRKFWNNNV